MESLQKRTKIIMSLALALCFVLVMPTLVRAENIYVKEDFDELGTWNVSKGGTQVVELKEDLTRTYLHIRNDMPNTLAQYMKGMGDISVDQEKLFVSINVKINEGDRYGVLYLHFIKDDGNSFNVYLYFAQANDAYPNGEITTSTGSRTFGLHIYMTPHVWITHKVDISQYMKNVVTNNWDYADLNLSKLRTVLFWGHATSLGLIDISFDSFVFSKSEYTDLVDLPIIVPDDSTVFQEFEFTTTHFIVFLIVGVALFILINKNRRKKVRGFIKKYLKV